MSSTDLESSHAHVELPSANINIGGDARVHLGDVYNYGVLPNQSQSEDVDRSFGVCLGFAPQIEPDAFKGRQKELQQLRDWLVLAHHQQLCVISIVGLGGMGKTQLSLAHVRDCADEYSSVFWMNAKDETSMRQDMAAASSIVIPERDCPPIFGIDDEVKAVQQFRRWLSEPKNDRWLLILDNYDDPQLPGIRSSTGYDIRRFFPTRSQGKILITTRSTKLAFSKQLLLKQIDDVSTSLAVLSQRANTELSEDNIDAVKLARRLGGLPLALATAGTYLGSSGLSCGEYLDLYKSTWNELFGVDADELFEYEARTLSSTWAISLQHVKAQNSDAAELLLFLAFLSPDDIWYELIEAGANDEVSWMQRVTKSKVQFQRAMAKLCDYSLIDSDKGSYKVHPCLHDWLVESLPNPMPRKLFIAALSCTANLVSDWSDPSYWTTSQRLLDHARHLTSDRFSQLWSMNASNSMVYSAAEKLARLESDVDQVLRSEAFYQRALVGKEITLGPEHPSTLVTVSVLGGLYLKQGKLVDAESMLKRAVDSYTKLQDSDDITTLTSMFELAGVCLVRGRLNEAEKLLQNVLRFAETNLGTEHKFTVDTAKVLGDLYFHCGRLIDAEQMLTRVLASREKTLILDHPSTLQILNELATLYRALRKPKQAIVMYERALNGNMRLHGIVNPSTLHLLYSLAALYCDEGRTDEAEQLFKRAIEGYDLFSRDGDLSIEEADNYSRILSRSIRSEKISLSECLSNLCRLIRLTRARGLRGLVAHHLAKALAFCRFEDDENAQIAVRYATNLACCDGCNLVLAVDTNRHVCRQCADIDLCSQCIAKYSTDDLILAGCSEHTFLHVDMTITLSAFFTEHSTGTANYNVWIDELLERYTAAAAANATIPSYVK